MVGVRRGRGPDTRLQRSWPVPDMPLKNKRLTPGRYQGTGGRGNWEADRQTDTLTGRKKKRLRERLVLLNGGTSGSGVRSTQVLYLSSLNLVGLFLGLLTHPFSSPAQQLLGQRW